MRVLLTLAGPHLSLLRARQELEAMAYSLEFVCHLQTGAEDRQRARVRLSTQESMSAILSVLWAVPVRVASWEYELEQHEEVKL